MCDADRDQAVAFLQEHMAQGRIDASEFDDWMSQALKAKRASELAVLFDDLPEPRPPSLGRHATFQPPPWQQPQQQHSFEILPWQQYAGSQPGDRIPAALSAIPQR